MCAEELDVEGDLRVKLQVKNEEAVRIRTEIERAKLEAQMLKLQLQVHGANGDSLIPETMGTGGKVRATAMKADLQTSEHKRLIEWLAENCDLTSKQALWIEPEVNVGGHRALLGQMVQWALNGPGGLRLSAPVEVERELVALLMSTHRGLLGPKQLEDFAENWLLVTTDLVADNVATPALFLIHKESQKAIVVAAWPNIFVEPPPALASFDPSAFFSRTLTQPSAPLPSPQALPESLGEAVVFIGKDGKESRLQCPAEGGMLWTLDGVWSKPVEELGVSFNMDEQFMLTGPFGYTVIADPVPGPMQRWMVSSLVALALDCGVRVQRSSTPMVPAPSCGESPMTSSDSLNSSMTMSEGDQVEVNYKGSWLRGILQAVQGEVAHVKCDVDANGVITVAPLDRVRLADFNIGSPKPESPQLTESFGQC